MVRPSMARQTHLVPYGRSLSHAAPHSRRARDEVRRVEALIAADLMALSAARGLWLLGRQGLDAGGNGLLRADRRPAVRRFHKAIRVVHVHRPEVVAQGGNIVVIARQAAIGMSNPLIC